MEDTSLLALIFWRTCYAILLILALPVVVIRQIVDHLRGQGRGKRGWQRVGLLLPATRPNGILVHCVSVGEVVMMVPLIQQCLGQGHSVTVTTTTATGAAEVERRFGDNVQHCYLPLDIGGFVARLLNHIKPAQMIIAEVEIWPNLLRACARRHIPVKLVNGRMTDRSFRRYQKASALLTPALASITCACVQGQRDYDNFQRLGISANALHVTGNLKFDLPDISQTAIDNLKQKIASPSRPLLLGGSTHAPEEHYLLQSLKKLRQQGQNLRLVIVPRHPQRFDEVVSLCKKDGWHVSRSSQLGERLDDQTDVLVVDEMGQLGAYYGIATLAFVGGSIAPRGGHNALEAARFGVPVIMGPSQHNNPQLFDALTAQSALFTITAQSDLDTAVYQLLTDPALFQKAQQGGLCVVAQNRGALQRTLQHLALLYDLLGPSNVIAR
ncbi:3-deoxy-D-manno-octulosonic acid transferase [Aestuariibacter halophilus]|uniref:3-deoxy-D-manno-octulosonic acid transferase n=1 Tax=Fluctibacter halophilus TaxID=226011 RepID=A0ABS8GAF5_9ALTE|nr:3-deoxy-D-manno-octulosonic acid transferase [Aestuariibacter halophilus]MCC2617517.1 3-deoxy-D-manno-octulosonic acid transferase [Aestuariibacter halophilus]